MDYSPPRSSVHGILQAGIPEWVPRPPPGDPSDPVMKPASLTSSAPASGFFTLVPPGKPTPDSADM